jgi:hypothetical protein
LPTVPRRRFRHERGLARELGFPLDPNAAVDFDAALANVDTILSAIASGVTAPRLGAGYITGQIVHHLENELLACDLFGMWSELTDLDDFTATCGEGERDVEMAIREAAIEWGHLSRDDEAATTTYFERWAAKSDLALWRERLGGPSFDSLNASGWFKWDDA